MEIIIIIIYLGYRRGVWHYGFCSTWFGILWNLGLNWFQDSWCDSRDSRLPNKKKYIMWLVIRIWKLQNENSKIIKFMDNLVICISWDSCDSKVPDKIHGNSSSHLHDSELCQTPWVQIRRQKSVKTWSKHIESLYNVILVIIIEFI